MYKLLTISGLLLFLLKSCIDPYQLHLSEYESLLVVDGMITDENSPYTITLTRTFQDKDTLPTRVTHANVSVRSEDGSIGVFNEVAPGIYRSDPSLFRGEAGKTYTLHISLGNREYVSNPCLMIPVPEIDTISFVPDEQFSANGRVEQEGIKIYVAPSRATEDCKYLKWNFKETWKIKIPYPVGYSYVGHGSVISIPVKNQICWKQDSSSKVLIYSLPTDNGAQIIKQPVIFIPSAATDKLTQQYSILIKQYSISKEAYNFWDNLKQVSEETGDIFDKQPFFVSGNIHSVQNKSEKVLGFFQVSAVTEKRIYITRNQIRKLHLPSFHYKCQIIEIGPEDYGSFEGQTNAVTFDDIYKLYTGMGYIFVYPLYHGLALERLAFATVACSDCSITADPKKPDFWIDLP